MAARRRPRSTAARRLKKWGCAAISKHSRDYDTTAYHSIVLRRAFSMFDSTKSGRIEKEKVRTILNTLGHTFDDHELEVLLKQEDEEERVILIERQVIRKLLNISRVISFLALGHPGLYIGVKSGSGKLNFDSFYRVACHFQEEDDEALQKELKEAFRLYDKEGNGYIPTSSLREILAALDDQITPDQMDGMIAEIDTDGSGTVDFDGEHLCPFLAWDINQGSPASKSLSVQEALVFEFREGHSFDQLGHRLAASRGSGENAQKHPSPPPPIVSHAPLSAFAPFDFLPSPVLAQFSRSSPAAVRTPGLAPAPAVSPTQVLSEYSRARPGNRFRRINNWGRLRPPLKTCNPQAIQRIDRPSPRLLLLLYTERRLLVAEKGALSPREESKMPFTRFP
ncbi:Troponin C [Melipona quadrifasciata]|uniref:Troponin C n=1 Tax=Melipona quadrifasciata TaxID=166423 RepID=A0A0M9ACI7_9HYME|nr:Troponin C [Melipona quadrifasciata]